MSERRETGLSGVDLTLAKEGEARGDLGMVRMLERMGEMEI